MLAESEHLGSYIRLASRVVRFLLPNLPYRVCRRNFPALYLDIITDKIRCLATREVRRPTLSNLFFCSIDCPNSHVGLLCPYSVRVSRIGSYRRGLHSET